MLDQAHRQFHAALVAAAERPGMAEAAVVKADVLEHGLCLLTDFDFRGKWLQNVDPESTVALGEGRSHDVLQDREIRDDLRRLEHPDDTHLVALVPLRAR